jgi:hypothetical protein
MGETESPPWAGLATLIVAKVGGFFFSIFFFKK